MVRPEAEKSWLIEALQRERDELRTIAGGHSAISALRSLLVWRFALGLFLIVTSGYGFSFFLPQIVKGLSGASDLAVGLWSAVPFAVAAVGMVTVAAHSDHTGERRWHVAACGALAAIGLGTSSIAPSPQFAFAALAVAAIGLYAFTPPFWSLPTAVLRGDGAAAGIGLINAVGNLGGFIGPFLMGWIRDASGDFRVGLQVLATAALLSGVVVATVRDRSG